MAEEYPTPFEQFQNLYLNDMSLQDRLKQTADKESFIDLLVELGADGGYYFNRQDVEAVIEKQAERFQVNPPTVDNAIKQFKKRSEDFPWSNR